MAKIKGTIEVNTESCKGCGVCVSICPVGVLELGKDVNGKGYYYVVMKNGEKDCIGCAGCAMICPDSVITVYKQKFE